MSVRWIGAQRDVLGGDVGGKISLRELGDLPHLYALGPRAGASGEITIFDSHPCIARVVDGCVKMEAGLGHEACFLVYDQVATWHATTPSGPIDGEEALQDALLSAAGAHGHDRAEPLAFLLRAPAARVTFHVLDKRDGAPHTPELHERAKVRFKIDDGPVEILGFYSTRHRGIFTPKDSDLHMHVRTPDGRLSGHVERLAVGPGAVVAVPRKE